MHKRRRTVPEGIRITRVGFWFVVLTLVVTVAATNTGNNALYLVLTAMLALLVVSGVTSRGNLKGLKIRVEVPDELFAKRPFQAYFEVQNLARFTPRWLLVLTLSHARSHVFIPYLSRGERTRGRIDLMLTRRGRHHVDFAHLWSVFPVGFFRKGLRYRLDQKILVYPEIFPMAATMSERALRVGDETTRRKGWGHELHSLREFRAGDDPRNIHWKRTARTGELVFMERQAEEGRRLAVIFDNAVGRLRDRESEERFEKLVSEAATAVHQYLQEGFEIELVTRDRSLGFGTGPGHRRRLLEHLALVEPCARRSTPLLATDPNVPEMRLAMKTAEAAA